MRRVLWRRHIHERTTNLQETRSYSGASRPWRQRLHRPSSRRMFQLRLLTLLASCLAPLALRRDDVGDVAFSSKRYRLLAEVFNGTKSGDPEQVRRWQADASRPCLRGRRACRDAVGVDNGCANRSTMYWRTIAPRFGSGVFSK